MGSEMCIRDSSRTRVPQSIFDKCRKISPKYIFSNDEFYDPVLHYTGWNPVTRLNNGIHVWEKPDISPLLEMRPRRVLPRYQRMMWGTLPIGALGLGLLTLLGLALTQNLISSNSNPFSRERTEAKDYSASAKMVLLTRSMPLIVAVSYTHLTLPTILLV